MPDEPLVVKLARQFKDNIAHRDTMVINSMASGYIDVYHSLNETILRLAEKIRNLPDTLTGELREQWVRELRYYQRLQALAIDQVGEYTSFAKSYILQKQESTILQGLADAETLMKFSVDPLGKYQFTQLPVEPLEFLKGVLGTQSDRNSLGKLLDSIKNEFSPHLDQILFQGLALGRPTPDIARDLAKASTMPLSRATMIARTEINRAYRISTTERYRQSPWVKSYKRIASKSGACMACLLLDGTEYPVDVLEDHPNGACAMVPVVTGATPPEWEYGSDYFQKLPEDEQQARMGKYYWKAWKNGEFSLADLIGTDHSPIWGNSPRIKALKTLVPDWRKKYFEPPKTKLHKKPSLAKKNVLEQHYKVTEADKKKWSEILKRLDKLPYDKRTEVLKAYQDYAKSLGENYKWSVKEYTLSGYSGVNKYLREGVVKYYNEDDLLKIITHLNKAIEKAPSNQDWLLLKRGLSEYPEFNLEVGETFRERGFMSTSKAGGFSADIEFRILVPPKSKGFMDVEPLSAYSLEHEVLFGEGAMFKCFNKYREGLRDVYELIYIGR